MSNELDAWMAGDGAAEADWSEHLWKLAARGELGTASAGLMLDLPALTQTYACVPSECTPGRREARTKSCCADLEPGLGVSEIAAIEGAMPEIAAFMKGRDARWADGAPAVFDGDTFLRPKKRCVMSVETPEGLRCGLHQLEDATRRPRGTLKPVPCRMFPLALVAIDEERRLLTALHKKTTSKLDAPSAKQFPCLRGDLARPPLYVSQSDTLTELFGAKAYKKIDTVARQWLARA